MFNSLVWNGGAGANGAFTVPRPVSAGSLTYDAYRALGVLRSGQTASPEMLEDGFTHLNDLIDSWNTERLIIYSIRRDVYALPAGATSFVLGPQEESGTRPKIEGISMLPSGQTQEHGLRLLTLDEYRSGHYGWYSDNAYPDALATFFPPAQAGQQLVIYSWQRLSGFADQETLYSFPPGYVQAMRWNLAVQLAPAARIYAKIPDVLYDGITENATQSKFVIKRLNAPELLMRCDPGLTCGGNWDITTGEYR